MSGAIGFDNKPYFHRIGNWFVRWAVNVFVNYAHARSSYFREFAIALVEICHELGGYLVRARMRNKALSDSTKKEIVAWYKNSLRSDMEEVSSMEQRYSKLVAKVDDDVF